MNNTGRTLFKMGTTRPNDPGQALFLERLHHVLRKAQGRRALRELLAQYELPVIQLKRHKKAAPSHTKRHAAS
jgi:hypothetical protein